MKCNIVEKDTSFFEEDKDGFRKVPLFGRGLETWYRLVDNGDDWKENGQFSRYSLKKSWLNDDNKREYASASIKVKEADWLIKGEILVVDEDHIIRDRRYKVIKKLQMSRPWSNCNV